MQLPTDLRDYTKLFHDLMATHDLVHESHRVFIGWVVIFWDIEWDKLLRPLENMPFFFCFFE